MLEVFKALSDENRLRILHLLYRQELCVCELEVLLDMSQSNVSRHLNKLRNSGIIITIKSGLWAHYRLNDIYFKQNPGLLGYLKTHWGQEANFLKDLKRLENYLSSNLSCKDITEDKNRVVQMIALRKKIVAFVCVHNSCRSQMAEGLARRLGSHVLEVYSAGTENYPEVKPLAVKVMEEKGIDMSKHLPKLLTDIPEEVDYLITMGCNVVCPYIPHQHMEDWGLEDPSGGPIEDYRKTRDLIEEKVKKLIADVEKELFGDA